MKLATKITTILIIALGTLSINAQAADSSSTVSIQKLLSQFVEASISELNAEIHSQVIEELGDKAISTDNNSPVEDSPKINTQDKAKVNLNTEFAAENESGDKTELKVSKAE